jgi:hypothetical protein
MSDGRRLLHLNAFLMEAGHHEASWRLPQSDPRADFDLKHWIALARLAESAAFDSLFLADGPAIPGTGEFRPPGQLEPLTLLTALSQATSRIGLIATVSSTYNEPYNLALLFAHGVSLHQVAESARVDLEMVELSGLACLVRELCGSRRGNVSPCRAMWRDGPRGVLIVVALVEGQPRQGAALRSS